MSKPKILDAITELDENGFYDKSTYLGDIRSTSNCLDSVFENGIYVFTGGTTSPTDTSGSYKWSLHVSACDECVTVRQDAKRLDSNLVFVRHYTNSAWSSFESTLPSASTSAAGIVKLSNSVSSTATNVAATSKAVKQAYDLALGGGNYGQHAWHKKGYSYYEWETGIKKSSFGETSASCYLTYGYTTDYQTSRTFLIATDATFNASTKQLILQDVRTYTYHWTMSSSTYTLHVTDSTGTAVDSNTLIMELRNLASTTGIYMVAGNSVEGNKVYFTDNANCLSLSNVSLRESENGAIVASAPGIVASNSSYSPSMGTYTYYELFAEVTVETVPTTFVDTYEGIDEVLYSSSRSTYQDLEGDNGKGLIYDYLGIASEELPKSSDFGRHLWHKKGYSYDIYDFQSTESTSYIYLLGYNTSSSHNTFTITTKRPQLGEDKYASLILEDVRTITFSKSSSVVTILSDSGNTVTDLSSLCTLLQSLAPSGVYVMTSYGPPTSLSDIYYVDNPDSIYLPKVNGVSTLALQGSSGSIPNITYTPFYKLSKSKVRINDYYKDVDEYIYTLSPTAFQEGDNGEGLFYMYIGKPADMFPDLVPYETGSYTGTGSYGNSNSANSITFSNSPRIIIIENKLYHIENFASTWVQYDNLWMRLSGSTLSWYSTTSATDQLNVSGVKYSWAAI